MKRRHFFEFHDQAWCPRAIRDAVTDYLQFSITSTTAYQPVAGLLAPALKNCGAHHVLDLCSGAAGPWLWLQPALAELGTNVTVCLSDKYPNVEAFERASQSSNHTIRFHPQPVDAMCVSAELTGFRTLFTSFHHFRPDEARALLQDAVAHRQGIGIFEATQRHPIAILLMLLAPVSVLILTPFIRPFKWSRLFWTYLVPVLPLGTLFDGIVSCLRTYTTDEMRVMTEQLDATGYQWKIGLAKTKKSPIPITYLIGIPDENANGS